jgi:hypothetical protein
MLNGIISRHGGMPESQADVTPSSRDMSSSGDPAVTTDASSARGDTLALTPEPGDTGDAQDAGLPLVPAALGHSDTLDGAMPKTHASAEDAILDEYARSVYLMNHAGQITL